MKQPLLRLALVLSIGLIAWVATALGESGVSGMAQGSSDAVKTPAPKVIFKKSESHRFSGAELKGRLKKPELSYIYERKGLKQEQIVNIPQDFNDEIIKDAGRF